MDDTSYMTINIIAVDSHTLNPGDLSWDPWRQYGDLTLYDHTHDTDTLVKRCAGAQAVLTNKVAFNEDTLRQLPELKYIGVTATGYNIIDTAAAKRLGIIVSNVPSYG